MTLMYVWHIRGFAIMRYTNLLLTLTLTLTHTQYTSQQNSILDHRQHSSAALL